LLNFLVGCFYAFSYVNSLFFHWLGQYFGLLNVGMLLTDHRSAVLLEKMKIAEVIKVSSLLYLVSCSQELTADPEPDESIPQTHILFFEDVFKYYTLTCI
jgi:hypothetical protein